MNDYSKITGKFMKLKDAIAYYQKERDPGDHPHLTEARKALLRNNLCPECASVGEFGKLVLDPEGGYDCELCGSFVS